jgi:hypothetical protein
VGSEADALSAIENILEKGNRKNIGAGTFD